MAQHYPVNDRNIIKSIKRIAPKAFHDIQTGLTMDWCYWGKQIQHLPAEHNPEGHAFLISPYNMRKVKEWKDEPFAEGEAVLEVHLSKTGEVQAVYYAL